MDIRELLGELESYYGPYDDSDGLKRTLVEYLREEIDPGCYDQLRRYVVRTHPLKFGPPDVAALETARAYAWEKDGVPLRKSLRARSWSTAESAGESITPEDREKAGELLGTIMASIRANASEAKALLETGASA